jgi:hypothetical protein
MRKLPTHQGEDPKFKGLDLLRRSGPFFGQTAQPAGPILTFTLDHVGK